MSDGGAPTLELTAPVCGEWRAPPDRRQNLATETVRHVHKRIVICADGTWNRALSTAIGGAPSTNVWLTYQLVKPRAADGTPQLAYYHPGVGTRGVFDRIVGGALGVGLGANILQCYRFLIEHYHPGDYLYLFGFSRGAYTVRSLAGLIRNCGIIDPERLAPGTGVGAAAREAFALYRDRGDATAPRAQRSVEFRARRSHPDFRIPCIGVWDTVGSLGIPIGLLGHLTSHLVGFHDVTLSSWVDYAFHAVAVDERRRPFVPTLWVQQPDARAHGQRVEQRWFTGVHSDVGGGYPWADRALATLALRWMLDRVTCSSRLELDQTLLDSAPPSAAALHESLTLWYRMWKPARRTIDGGLGHHGARDGARITDECVDGSVKDWRDRYGSAPMPVVDRIYAPENVTDYAERLAQAEISPPVQPPDYPPDTRPVNPSAGAPAPR